MSSAALHRFAQAKEKVERTMIDPVTELLEATTALVAEERLARKETDKCLEELRPVWAQGWSTDSIAAQAAASALSDLWAMLGVKNQTDAVERLKELIK
jgi:hypothetical protein